MFPDAIRISPQVRRRGWTFWITTQEKGPLLTGSVRKWHDLSREDILADDWEAQLEPSSEDPISIRFRLIELK